MLTEERFKIVCEATRWNVRAALDLISIHAEQDVRGLQPRASLNPYIALAAFAAWERFLGDLGGAATVPDGKWDDKGLGKGNRGPGHERLTSGLAYHPKDLNGYLRNRGVLSGDFSDGWEAVLAASWAGVTPKRWRYAEYRQDPDVFHEALDSAAAVRNGAAHMALPGNVTVVPTKAASVSVDSDELEAVTDGAPEPAFYWTNDAEAPTIQNGHARLVTALCVQLIDSSIAHVAKASDWGSQRYRLPDSWFAAKVPAREPRYAGVEFWGGQALHRVV
ncbi:hypothetical protein AB0J38_21915 [Streptomyces sp. NPDC050095]|uniref:hypothetical protein n=1 Tax=unclassified Streptomyces TaxID=2593676 RepID=UPI00342191AF